jgi:hypothetical protein
MAVMYYISSLRPNEASDGILQKTHFKKIFDIPVLAGLSLEIVGNRLPGCMNEDDADRGHSGTIAFSGPRQDKPGKRSSH